MEGPAGFMPIRTRNQKQKLKVQHVLPKQPSKSRARGDSQQVDQLLFFIGILEDIVAQTCWLFWVIP